MSEAVAKKKNTAYYINSIISLIIIFGLCRVSLQGSSVRPIFKGKP